MEQLPKFENPVKYKFYIEPATKTRYTWEDSVENFYHHGYEFTLADNGTKENVNSFEYYLYVVQDIPLNNEDEEEVLEQELDNPEVKAQEERKLKHTLSLSKLISKRKRMILQ